MKLKTVTHKQTPRITCRRGATLMYPLVSVLAGVKVDRIYLTAPHVLRAFLFLRRSHAGGSDSRDLLAWCSGHQKSRERSGQQTLHTVKVHCGRTQRAASSSSSGIAVAHRPHAKENCCAGASRRISLRSDDRTDTPDVSDSTSSRRPHGRELLRPAAGNFSSKVSNERLECVRRAKKNKLQTDNVRWEPRA